MKGIYSLQAYGLTIDSELALTGLDTIDPHGSAPDVVIALASALEEQSMKLSAESWLQVSSQALSFAIPGVAAFLVEEGRRIRVAPEKGADPAEVRIFLLGSAMGALLYQRGIFPLHGSAVETPWGAMVFVGPSGIGKSTLAAHFHHAGHRLIADDVCAIAHDDHGNIQVLPAFPHLRLMTDAVDRLYGEKTLPPLSHFDVDKVVLSLGEDHVPTPVPLGAVHVIEDADSGKPSLTPLRGFKSIQVLADNLYRPYFLQGMQSRGEVLRLAGEIAQSVEVVQLSRKRDAANLDRLVLWLEHEWEGRFGPFKPSES